jgi:S-DNA-T family DNA segregation ATPase FtsK/SpoIIIE
MRKAKQPTWPLRRTGAVDLFRPQPFGTDQRGRWVFLTLMFASVIIGALPRVGKTFAVRELLLIAALDPRSRIYAYDNKGTGDLKPLECVAHCYGKGEEDEALERELAEMRGLKDELRRRAKVINDLPDDLCPESKVTPQLADQRSYGLYPIVIGADECQVWFEHPEHGTEFEAICTDLVKRGPALGMILILATQRPDAKSLPTGISANAQIRYCLKVMGQVENDMVLGTSQYKAGVRATMFARDDLGIGYLVGEGADARIVRTAYLDKAASSAIALRGRAMRDAAGTLSGHCIGEREDLAPSYDLLDDVQFVYARAERRDRPGVWSVDLCAGLAKLRPEVYDGWDPDTLAAALKPYALTTGQLNMLDAEGNRYNRRGIGREALDQALAVRAERRGPRAVEGGVDV